MNRWGDVVKSGKDENGYDKSSSGQDAPSRCLSLLSKSGDSGGLIATALQRGNKLFIASHKSDSYWWVEGGGGDATLATGFKQVRHSH